MPTPAPKLPDEVNYAVIAAIGIMSVAGVLLLLARNGPGFVLAAGFAGATYWFGYRNLDGDRVTAKTAFLVTAIVAAVFALLSLLGQALLGFVVDGVAAGCLGYAFWQLRLLEQAPGGPGAAASTAAGNAAAPPSAVADAASLEGKLRRLGELRDAGVLTPEEYEMKKRGLGTA